jgi:hypothetical protein
MYCLNIYTARQVIQYSNGENFFHEISSCLPFSQQIDYLDTLFVFIPERVVLKDFVDGSSSVNCIHLGRPKFT